MLRWILTVVQLFSAVGIIGLVLLQRGKGAEAGAGFGAGASGTVFGARGATTALSRATAVLAAIFMINSLALAYMGTRAAEAPKTLLEEAGSRPAPAPGGTPTPVAPPVAPAASTGTAPGTATGTAAGTAPPATTAPAVPAPTPAPTPAPK